MFLRVYPIVHWSYSDVWYFLRTMKLDYCNLYDIGYTSLGYKSETVPNELLKGKPAWMLTEVETERQGRSKL